MQLRLVADTVRSHRNGIALWVVVGAVAQYAVGLLLAREFSTTPGGAKALAAAVETAAQAMRVLRWPAERLDTLGGYVTYHNILLLPLLLGLYAAIAGAQAVRGGEARGGLEELLATGWSRAAVVRDRTLGYVAVLAVIVLGIGLGTALGLASGGEPDIAGSFISVGEAALCAFVFYALALLVAQLTRTSRTAVGVTVLVMAALYAFTNVWDKAGVFGILRFASPFFYFQQSRVLVPGHAFDAGATATLVAMSGVLLAAGAWAFARRDYGSPLWQRRTAARAGRPPALRRPWLRSYATAALARQWLGLLGWAGGVGAFAVLVTYLEPEVRRMWGQVEYFMRFFATAGGTSLTDQYLGFAGELLAPIAGAYAATQVAAWVSDLRQGRVEALLTTPLSWTRLVIERLLALAGGVTVIAAAAVAGVAVGAAIVGVPLRADGLLRLAALALLFGLATGAAGAVLAAWLRSALATALLAVFLVVSYMVDLLGPAFDWPDWIGWLSVFNAFGQPYVAVPPPAGLALLAGVALGGALVAAWLSERSAKVA